MKTEIRLLIGAAALLFMISGCAPEEKNTEITPAVHETILTDFTRLRIQYNLYAEKTPENQELLRTICASRGFSASRYFDWLRNHDFKLFNQLLGLTEE